MNTITKQICIYVACGKAFFTRLDGSLFFPYHNAHTLIKKS